MEIQINEIIVENRRREDFGDVEELAESIRRLGLFHPIVVAEIDGKYYLVAGERRKRACELLEWSRIPVRLYKDLSDEERNEIELEENAKRKDLTPYEQSKNIVKLVEVATKIIQSANTNLVESETDLGLQAEVLSHDGTKANGRPREIGNLREVAEKIGIPKSTIGRAKQHVEAVEKYPEIVSVPTQKDAINIAKALDNVDDKKQKEIRADLAKGRIGEVTKIVEEYKRNFPKGQNPSVNFADTIYKIHRTINSINHHGGISYIWREWSKQERISYYENVKDLAGKMSDFILEMEEQLNEQD